MSVMHKLSGTNDGQAPPRASRAEAPGESTSLLEMTFGDIIGESEKLREVIDMGKQLAGAALPSILIQGETGTGKELFARALHDAGAKGGATAEPFVEINSSAIPDSLLETELFGYEKGAFTDASSSKQGLLEVANGGSLFLDEIGNMSLNLQAKLLKVLEEKRFRRLGGTEEIEVGVKIIAATNTDLQAAIRDGFFRSDLYYRLAIVSMHLPPLRERDDDVILLARHFLEQFSAQHDRPAKKLSKRTEKLLKAYDWPGNVRELRNAMQRAVLLSKEDTIHPDDVSLDVRSYVSLSDALPGRITEAGGGAAPVDDDLATLRFDPLATSLDEMERRFIERTLNATGWNKSRSATILKISRPRLLRKLKALGIEKDGGEKSPVRSPENEEAR